MKLATEHKYISAALDIYRHWLDEIPEDEFTQTPPGGGWSYAELYAHTMQAGLGSIIAAEKCYNKTGVNTSKGLNPIGWYVFLLNCFPPVKVEQPEAMATLTKKISKEEARNLIIKLRKRLDEIMPQVVHNSSSGYKISHPRLGMLTAAQWIKFIRIHTQHHLKQLGRIKKSFQQK